MTKDERALLLLLAQAVIPSAARYPVGREIAETADRVNKAARQEAADDALG